MIFRHQLLVPVVLVSLLCGCNTGHLVVDLTDSPADEATTMQIQFNGIELIRDDGSVETFDFATPKKINMLALREGKATSLLDNVELKPGKFSGIRLKVSAGPDATDSFVITSAGITDPLFLADSAAGNLTLNGVFEVVKQKQRVVTLDFDMRSSVLKPAAGDAANKYQLVPVLRLVRNEDAGEISGTVDPALIAGAGCTPAIYAWAGSDVTPSDLGSGAASPLASARVLAINGIDSYRLPFMPRGDYTLALTCDASADDPSIAEDTIGFGVARNVSVSAGLTTPSNF